MLLDEAVKSMTQSASRGSARPQALSFRSLNLGVPHLNGILYNLEKASREGQYIVQYYIGLQSQNSLQEV